MKRNPKGANTPKRTCIWCRREHTDRSVEHIVPESLGCPSNLVLRNGEVCDRCNSKLARLDRVLTDDFDFFRFFHNVPRKGGRSPVIRSRGNVIGRHNEGEWQLLINLETHDVVDTDGTRIPARGRSPRNVAAKVDVGGEKPQLSFDVKIGESPLFPRAIHKIAFERLVLALGTEEALRDWYDPVRQYVLKGAGNRAIIVSVDGPPEYWTAVQPPVDQGNGEYTVAMRIVRLNFVVDLTPEMRRIHEAVRALRRQRFPQSWGLLPPGYRLPDES